MPKINQEETTYDESNFNYTNNTQSNLEDEQYDSISTKPSKTTSKTNLLKPKKKSKQSKSKTTSNTTTQSKNIEKDLKLNMKDYFGYEFRSHDLSFLKELYLQLPKLNETWDRIGFNKETKETRLDNFYKTLTDTVIEIVENEEQLEADIEQNIEMQHKKLKEICFRLQIKYDELKVIKNGENLTMLEEDEQLRQELKRLEIEVKKRLDEFDVLAKIEAKLCDKLVVKKTELKSNIPSEVDLNNIKNRIEELEKICQERKKEMLSLQEQISTFNNDLEMSTADSFVEAIIFESVEEITLSDRDLKKATELRDDLKRKHNQIVDQINSLKSKIKELWTKLNIDNLNIKSLINSTLEDNKSEMSVSKRTLVNELEKEYERCVKIKMENMQKFIESIRTEIKEYCAKMFIGDKEMKKLNQDLLSATNYTEQLLTQHEEKLEDLKFKYTESEALYDKTCKWIQLWNEFIQFEEKTKDPQRFKQRGYNMLIEEKQRKTFQSQLPKLEEDLTILANEYKELNGGQDFTINGRVYSDFIHLTRLDYEESKQKEKYEKQVLKDNIKKNESRFGSKPITPLALKNKRKLANNNQDTVLNTPGRKSKLQRTDLMLSSVNSPGSTMISKLGSSKVKTIPGKSKLSISKRKSRTPGGKNRLLRRSKLAAKNEPNEEQDTTIKTYTTLSSTIQSTLSSNSSNLYNSKMTNSKTSSKCPPLSSSSKYVQNGNTHRMTSTASNTFIEEENNENFKEDELVSKAAQKISEMVSIKSAQTCTVNSKLYNCDVNYIEFSRDLPKPIKFGHDSTNSTSSSRSVSRTASTKSVKK